MFSRTPLFRPCQNPQPWTLYNAHNYCKISLSGGLAQLVEQRTLNNCKFYRVIPCKPITATFLATSGWSISDNTPQHTIHKKSHCDEWLFS